MAIKLTGFNIGWTFALILGIALTGIESYDREIKSLSNTRDKGDLLLKSGVTGYQKILKMDSGNNSRRECEPFNTNHLKFFMSLFCIISFGALSRWILKVTGLPISYTIFVMITGIFLGLGNYVIAQTFWTSGCEDWSMYTRISRMPSQILLYVFLPVLIFEPASTLNPRLLTRSIFQILSIAVPGMLIVTFVLAVICQYVFSEYNWTYTEASFFAAIISGTDPVALISIFKEIRAPEVLKTKIEGESLVNTGVSILLFKIFAGILTSSSSMEGNASEILRRVAQIALGGPAFGYLAAKITGFFLSLIFNDAIVEISITIVAAYLTYYIGDVFLGITGIVPVVALGLAMSSETTSISPEAATQFREFWRILHYLTSTVLLTIVGIAMAESSINSFQLIDLGYLVFLYVALLLIRALVLILLTPLLCYLGYGWTWRHLVVTIWSGIRGAVSVCLALLVFTNPELCHRPQIGSKAAGIVFLTLLINGTTTQALVNAVGLTKISNGRRQHLEKAYEQVIGTQTRTMAALKYDRFLGDSEWEMVQELTAIESPYVKASKIENSTNWSESISKGKFHLGQADNNNIIGRPPNLEDIQKEFQELSEEARLSCLKALHSSFQRQYEEGTVTKRAFKILRDATSAVQENPQGGIIEAKIFSKYWTPHGAFPRLQTYFDRKPLKFPAIQKLVGGQISKQLFLGYDIAQGLTLALEDVIHFLPQIISHPQILKELKASLERERLETIREMGLFQKERPGIAIAHKTRFACRAVLNQMQETLETIKEDGLTDIKENTILVSKLEEKIKRLKNSPHFMSPLLPESLLDHLPFVNGNDAILTYIKKYAKLVSFNSGEKIVETGHCPNGIFIIVSGIVRVNYVPKDATIQKYEKYGIVPNAEIFRDLTFRSETTEFLTTGAIIGEKGVLTGEASCSTMTSQTGISAYHLSQICMKNALGIFADSKHSLISRIWRSYGIKIALAFLPTQPAFALWSLYKIRMHLESSFLANMADGIQILEIPEHTSDVIIIHGQVKDYRTNDVYQAPSLIPQSCSKICRIEGTLVHPRILLHNNFQNETFWHFVLKSNCGISILNTNLLQKMDSGYYIAQNFPPVPVPMESMSSCGDPETQNLSTETVYGYPQFPWVPIITNPSTPVSTQPTEVLCRLPQKGAFASSEYLYLQPRPNMAYYLDVCPNQCCPSTIFEVPVNSGGVFSPAKTPSCCGKRHTPNLETVPEEMEDGVADDYVNILETCGNFQNIPMPEPDFDKTAEKSCQTDFRDEDPSKASSSVPINESRIPVDIKVLFDPKVEKKAPVVKRTSKTSQGYCKFCRSNGEPFDVFSSHVFKNHLNETMCPILRKYVCPLCGKTGTEAHTQKYCSKATEQDFCHTRFYRKSLSKLGDTLLEVLLSRSQIFFRFKDPVGSERLGFKKVPGSQKEWEAWIRIRTRIVRHGH
ncbi:unnamed protein product [Allacma fusca]|uniref:Uncharacterized protein n=1 Tax=Allacma fusca TaxID=39272 RepID=A0A8J2LQN1_9HEXA|nr:unnamed protein product [Allacma fusca]